jgi:hypothetical protein
MVKSKIKKDFGRMVVMKKIAALLIGALLMLSAVSCSYNMGITLPPPVLTTRVDTMSATVSAYTKEPPVYTTGYPNFTEHTKEPPVYTTGSPILPENTTSPTEKPNVHVHVFDRYEYKTGDFYCSSCGIREDMVEECAHNGYTFIGNAGGSATLCIDCAAHMSKRDECAHDYEFKVIKEPTFYDVGIKSAECEKCGYRKAEIIPPTNTGSYICDFTLQEYADAASDELHRFAQELYTYAEAEKSVDWVMYPFGNMTSYEKIKDFTLELVKNEKTDYDKVKKIYTWVIQNIKYSDSASFYDVGKVWETKQGVCSQYVQLTHDMLSSIGVMSSYVGGYSSDVPWNDNNGVKLPTVMEHMFDVGHAVVACYVDGKVVVMDPTWGAVLGGEKYFDMSAEELASYFIACEFNFLKIVPKNVDIRNYGFVMYYSGGKIFHLSYGKATDSGAIVGGVNNLSFIYDFVKEDNLEYIVSGAPQWIDSSYVNCVVYNLNNILRVHLPDGRRVTYDEFLSYVLLENGKYGKNIALPLSENYVVYDGCLYRLDNGEYILEKCNSEASVITVPGAIKGIPVKATGANSFMNNEHIKKIYVEEGVKEICGFSYSSLEEIYLPSTLTMLGGIVDARRLSVIDIDSRNTRYKSIDNVVYTFDGSVLVHYAAQKNSREYTVPDGTKVIQNISYNPYLEKLVLPESVEVVGWLRELKSLGSVNLGNNVKTLHTLTGTAITELVLPDGITNLDGCALALNTLLKKVTLPAHLEQICNDTFEGASSLEEIVISSANKRYSTLDGVLYDNDTKTLLIYPKAKNTAVFHIAEGTENVADFAFAVTPNLKEVVLPESLKVLGTGAFDTSSIEKIDLKNVEEIGGGCFAGCKNLKNLILTDSVRIIRAQAFYFSGIEYIIVEDPSTKAEEGAFLGSDNMKIFLAYKDLTDKEKSWEQYVDSVYSRNAWKYENGIPVLR